MSPGTGRPQTPQALRRSLDDRLRAAAGRRGVAAPPIRKQYVFALLFKRMFSQDTGRWTLLGGNALLLRTGGGRFTDDIDLARTDDWADENTLLSELREIGARDAGDGFRFDFTHADLRDHTDRYGYGTRSARLHGQALLANKLFEPFTIDVTLRRHIEGPVDRITPRPVIDHESLHDLPEVPLVPIENHLADKICAMYELHQDGKPSNRYRDLADIVRIVSDLEISASRLAETLLHEQGRREITLPLAMTTPHSSWTRSYAQAAEEFSEFPAKLHSLDASIHKAGNCLDPVLSGDRTDGTWNPTRQAWTVTSAAQ